MTYLFIELCPIVIKHLVIFCVHSPTVLCFSCSAVSDSLRPERARQVPQSMGIFSRQEYWIGLPCPAPGDFLQPRLEPASPVSPALQADSLPLSHQGSPGVKRKSGLGHHSSNH